MEFGNNLKKLRKEHKISQEDLANKLGVSRQSVSKWEVGASYPEMDKVIKLCEMFDLKVDDILNININEIKEEKEKENIQTKFYDNFLNYITKVYDLFSSLTFFEKLKFFIKSLLLLLIIYIIFGILKGVLLGITRELFYSLNIKGFNIFSAIIVFLFSVFYVLLVIIASIHIFKIRYLDYIEIVKEDVKDEENNNIEDNKKEKEENEENNEDKYIKAEVIEDKKKKIIIRDRKDSNNNFLNFILNIFLFFIKFIATCFLLIPFSILVSSITVFTLSFVIIGSGSLFLSLILCSMSGIIFSLISSYILFNFIFTRKQKPKLIFISIILSIVLFSFGIGIFLTGLPKYITNFKDKEFYKEFEIDASVNDFEKIHVPEGQVSYIEDETLKDKYKIRVYYPKVLTLNTTSLEENKKLKDYYIYTDAMSSKRDIVQFLIKGLNKKKFLTSKIYVEISSSAKNIAILKEGK